MDYSLLVAIHNLDLAAKDDAEHRRNNSIDGENSAGTKTSTAKTSQSPIILRKGSIVSRRKLVAHSTTLESIQMRNEPSGKGDYSRLDGIPARNAKGERLIVFLGIIDILQNYRLAKKIEHALKATIHDGDSISVHHPALYSQRFTCIFYTIHSAGSPAPGNIVLHSPVYTSDKKDWSPKSQSQQKSGHTAARDDV
ncbi:phosphatidylinositol 4-phosphate 5-kinase type-1 alpha-like isoform X2 [Daphnia pulex]|uniref:phosphatidylinositol 4-phosphate 5-kinase type-1 alpha-like isoform X2 n=1 Tax=Daphnia pulex TaxID=6669 RepID=UPI001EE12C9A|nr:phosphatidylinositol 4-phosphate 5-kinase type-1 alpha-like isoform X2 [Daphnia pulex]